MTNKEIAEAIHAHLKRFEADPEINKRPESHRLLPYYQAGSWASGRWIGVRYVSFQGETMLTKTQAEKYLAWLDNGNIGQHYQALET